SPLPGSVLDAVTELLDKNLVQREGPDARVGMLETMREYGCELLEASGEADVTARAHAEQFLAMVRGAGAPLKGPDQIAWFARFELEHDNLRAALGWARDRGEV